eukprot:312510_1
MESNEQHAIIIIDKIIKTVIKSSNVITLAKYFNLNQHLPVQELRETIGDVFISSNFDYPEDVYKKIDEILKEELKYKTIIDSKDIPFIFKQSEFKIKLWQGDITALKIGAIVNAANTKGLGCFVAEHKCIDNIIHRNAGPRLRKQCKQIFENNNKEQKENLPTGTAIITNGYCLPSNYVIHTPGPIGEKPKLLRACYISVLNLCKKHKIRSVAFCCISTGLFGYPQENAAKVAIATIKKWLSESNNKSSKNNNDTNSNYIDYIVFNVFTNKDLKIYNKLLNDK